MGERMFEDLDDPAPIASEPSHRDEVARRARRITADRRARRQRVVAGSLVVALVAIGSLVAVRAVGHGASRTEAGSVGSPSADSKKPPGQPSDSAQPQSSTNSAKGPAVTVFGPRSYATSAQGAAANPQDNVAPAPLTAAGTNSTVCPTPALAPEFVNGEYCGPHMQSGNGTGPGGECTGTERVTPCGPRVVTGRFYPMSLPVGCSHPFVFDGRRWWPHYAVPGTVGTPTDAWLRLDDDGSVQVVAPFGAFGLTPVSAGKPSSCTTALPSQSTSNGSEP
jgi:hypothetical protein